MGRNSDQGGEKDHHCRHENAIHSSPSPQEATKAPEDTMKRYPLIAIAMIAALAACSTPNSSVPTDVKPAEAVEVPAAPFTDPVLTEVSQMTQEQIEALSPEKLADLQARVEAETAKIDAELAATRKADGSGNLSAQAESNCGSYTYPAWPNAALTKKCYFNVDYNTYRTKVRFWYSGPDWSSDGCGKIRALGPFGKADYVFRNVCIHLDFAYRNMPRYRQFRNYDQRLAIDKRFYSQMNSRCRERYAWVNPNRYVCYGVATAYYGAIRIGGATHYYTALTLYP
jgi:Prokaryotic phospholipase A2